jgi:hypothetical protein
VLFNTQLPFLHKNQTKMTTKNADYFSPQDFASWKEKYFAKLNRDEREQLRSILSGNFCKEKCLEAKIQVLGDSLLYFR